MSDLFSKLGALAQQAGLSGFSGTGQNSGVPAPRTDGVGDLLGSLKNSIPGGVGGLLGAGALGGILGTLMSGKTAKKVASGALVAGGTAAAAALAWTMYQKWQQGSVAQENAPASPPVTPVPSAGSVLSGFGAQSALSAAADPTAMLVLTSMVFAARADGYMDPDEQAAVHGMMQQLFPGTDVAAQVDGLMRCPVDPHALARMVSGAEQGRDVYRLSCMVIVADQAMERAYLDALAQALGIDPAEKARLEGEVQALKRQE